MSRKQENEKDEELLLNPKKHPFLQLSEATPQKRRTAKNCRGLKVQLSPVGYVRRGS
jgi:hypothetical protein